MTRADRAAEILRLLDEARRHAACDELHEAREHAAAAADLIADQIGALITGDDA